MDLWRDWRRDGRIRETCKRYKVQACPAESGGRSKIQDPRARLPCTVKLETGGEDSLILERMRIADDIYQRVVTAKLYIDDNFSEPIDLKDISEKAFLSRFHFHRLFTRIYRKTPHQYLTRKRIEKAKDLLAENKPVTDVCNEVGFESIGSFSVLFKKEIGFAPQYYRNMAWLKKQEAKEQPKKFIPHCFIESYRLDDAR